MIVYMLAVLGVISLLTLLGGAFWSSAQYAAALLVPYFQPNEAKTLKEKYGDWAVITGSTDGIGKEYARELAKRGINIVLVSRNQNKLDKVANEIETEFAVKTKTIAADFSHGKTAYKHIQNELEGFPVGILVNNVGKQYSYPQYLGEVPEEDIWDIINVNIGAVSMMCRLLIEPMRARGKGAIVNVASGSELVPLPLMTVYAATKVYVKSFTAALRFEYASSGLTIQHLAPFFVNTKMNAFSDRLLEPRSLDSFFVPDAKAFARSAVNTLGRTNDTTGYWTHGIQYAMIGLVPMWLRTYVGGKMNLQFRKEYFERETSKVPNIDSKIECIST